MEGSEEHFNLIETSNVGWFISLRRPDASWELTISDIEHPTVLLLEPVRDEPWGQRHFFVQTRLAR